MSIHLEEVILVFFFSYYDYNKRVDVKATAESQCNWWGTSQTFNIFTNNWRFIAGTPYRNIELYDASEIEQKMKGFVKINVSSIPIKYDKSIQLKDIRGRLEIAKNSDFFGDIKVLAILLNENQEFDPSKGVNLDEFNVLQCHNLKFSSDGIVKTGVFKDLDFVVQHTDTSDILDIDIDSLEFVLNENLNNDKLIFAFYSDGRSNLSKYYYIENKPYLNIDTLNLDTSSLTLNVYPNPIYTNSSINIKNNEEIGMYKLELFDASGFFVKEISSDFIEANKDIFVNFNSENLNKGFYFIKYSINGAFKTVKIQIL